MLVAQKSGLMARSTAEVDGKSRSIYEAYDVNYHFDRAVYKPCTSYDVVFVDANNKPLHDVAINYVAKGANGASFAAEYAKFIDGMITVHAKLNKIGKKGKDNKFKSLCVFEPKLSRELVGDKTKAMACKVVGYVEPTPANFIKNFAAADYLAIWDVLNPITPKEYKVVGYNNESAMALVTQDPGYLEAFLKEASRVYGNDRSSIEKYCQEKYHTGLAGMSNNQLLNATSVLEDVMF
jgi:hypothetical protein